MDETCTLDRNVKESWEAYFQDGWEKNGGRQQTRLFAHYFLRTVRLPNCAESLLDVGCALGDALLEIHRYYPHLRLYGCDISRNATEKARETCGNIAAFYNWDFDQIEGHFDIIYCSNTLEHFENYLDIARGLLTHCRFLYVLVPFLELSGGKPLRAEPGEWHVATFDKHSFDPLVRQGLAQHIRSWVRHTPGAWGTGPIPLRRKLSARLRGRPVPTEYRQVFFQIIASGSRAS